jgi:hypothetical protein
MRLSNASKRVAEPPRQSARQSRPSLADQGSRTETPRTDKLSPGRAMRLCLILALAAWLPVIGLLYLIFD